MQTPYRCPGCTLVIREPLRICPECGRAIPPNAFGSGYSETIPLVPPAASRPAAIYRPYAGAPPPAVAKPPAPAYRAGAPPPANPPPVAVYRMGAPPPAAAQLPAALYQPGAGPPPATPPPDDRWPATVLAAPLDEPLAGPARPTWRFPRFAIPAVLLAVLLGVGLLWHPWLPKPPDPFPFSRPAIIYSTSGAGGAICRSGTVNGPCETADPAASPPMGADYGNIVEAYPAGTLAGRTRSTKFRLLPASQIQLQPHSALSLAERFLLESGQALFDHTNGAGEIEVEAGAARIQPVDTQFSVRLGVDGLVTVAVWAGNRGAVISSTTGTVTLGENQQVDITPDGRFGPPQPLRADTRQAWMQYGNGADLTVALPVPVEDTPTMLPAVWTNTAAPAAPTNGPTLPTRTMVPAVPTTAPTVRIVEAPTTAPAATTGPTLPTRTAVASPSTAEVLATTTEVAVSSTAGAALTAVSTAVATSLPGEVISPANAAQLTPLRTISGPFSNVWSWAIAPDGQTAALGGLGPQNTDGLVGMVSLADGRQLRTLRGPANGVESVAFSPDGQLLAAGSEDQTLRLWQVADGTLVRTLTSSNGLVHSVAFAPDGQTLAAGLGDSTIRLWRVADGQLLRTFTGHQKEVLHVAFAPDGQTLASASLDNTVRLWRVADGTLLHTLNGHTGWVWSVAFAPDGRTLASGSTDNTVRFWRTTDGRLVRTIKVGTSSPLSNIGDVDSVAFAPDGQTLTGGSSPSVHQIYLWRVADGTLLNTLSGFDPRFTANGHLLTAIDPSGKLAMWGVGK